MVSQKVVKMLYNFSRFVGPFGIQNLIILDSFKFTVPLLAGALARHTGQENTSHHWNLLQVPLQHINVTSCRYLYNRPLPPSPALGATKKNALVGVYYQWGYLM